MKKIGKIAIVGVGMIGGSMGLALKSKRIAREVIGIGHRRSSISKALRLKTIDKGTLELEKGVEGADIVIMATPVLSIAPLVKRITPHLKKGCIITDVGSVKGRITRDIERSLPGNIHFVGGHPMAGSEKRGVDEAKKNLFNNSICILTRTKATKPQALALIRDMWLDLGARVIIVTPSFHDKAVSEVSHLPHMSAFSLLLSVHAENLKFASTGFYDITRIASSDPYIWRDIAIANGPEISKSLSRFIKNSGFLKSAIDKKDGRALLMAFKKAKKTRELRIKDR